MSRPYDPATSAPNPPAVIGPFRIVRVLGTGGMGAVYLGERIEEFAQQVAIKILHPSLFAHDNEALLAREGQFLAVLDHRGIVRMLDAGVSADGSRYIVMEYVDGLPIDIFCDQNRLPLRRRIEILLAVIQAVDHAHRHLVVHADLKPGNILVNRDAEPRLLDFGIAALLADASSTRGEHYTALFASPEQRAGERLTLASDVYALGLIMQHVLFGLPPDPPSLASSSSSPASAVRRLSRLDKTSLNEIASLRQTKPSKLIHELHGDLAFILSKALQPSPEDRFKSAHELHDELQRFLLGYPIQTRSVSPLTRLHKWVLRNKLAASFAMLLIAAILLSAVGIVARAREAARKRQMATSRLHELVRLTDSLAGELYDSLHGLQGSEKAQAALLASAHQTVHKLEAEHDNDAQLKLELAQEYEKLARLEISVTPQTAESTHQSREDTGRELAILKSLPASDPNVAALLKRAQQQGR